MKRVLESYNPFSLFFVIGLSNVTISFKSGCDTLTHSSTHLFNRMVGYIACSVNSRQMLVCWRISILMYPCSSVSIPLALAIWLLGASPTCTKTASTSSSLVFFVMLSIIVTASYLFIALDFLNFSVPQNVYISL